MFSSKERRRTAGRLRTKTIERGLERLETRTLLSFSSLGASLPDLTVAGSVPPVAAYGGPITVSVDVSNIGYSSMVEPLALVPNSVSRADAGPSVVGVYLSTNPHRFRPAQSVKIGSIPVSFLRQNSTFELTETLDMPSIRPRGFPVSGGLLWVWFRADDTRSVLESNEANNVRRGTQPVQLFAALPQLATIALDAPDVMSPGDVIEPTFKLANFGTFETLPQGPVLIYLVASTDLDYGPTDIVLASYTVNNIQPLANAPALFTSVLGDVTLDNPPNVLTVGNQVVTLPTAPERYFIGFIVDPLQTIRQISDLDGPRSSRLSEVRVVGPPIHGLNPANQVGTSAPPENIFPTPAYGLITSPFFPPDATLALNGTSSVLGRAGVAAVINNQSVGGSNRGTGSTNGRGSASQGVITPLRTRSGIRLITKR